MDPKVCQCRWQRSTTIDTVFSIVKNPQVWPHNTKVVRISTSIVNVQNLLYFVEPTLETWPRISASKSYSKRFCVCVDLTECTQWVGTLSEVHFSVSDVEPLAAFVEVPYQVNLFEFVILNDVAAKSDEIREPFDPTRLEVVVQRTGAVTIRAEVYCQGLQVRGSQIYGHIFWVLMKHHVGGRQSQRLQAAEGSEVDNSEG